MFQGEAKLARHTPLFVCLGSLHIICRQQSLTWSRIVPSSEEPEGSKAKFTKARFWTISPVCKLKFNSLRYLSYTHAYSLIFTANSKFQFSEYCRIFTCVSSVFLPLSVSPNFILFYH